MIRSRSILGLAAVVLVVAAASLAQGQTAYYWSNSGPGNWSNPNNWTSYSGYTTYINNNQTVAINPGDTVTDMTGGYGTVVIGGGGGGNYTGDTGGNGYVNMTGGVLKPSIGAGNLMSQTFGVGYQPDGVTSSSGVFTQSGGVNCPFQNPNPDAEYNEFGSYNFDPTWRQSGRLRRVRPQRRHGRRKLRFRRGRPLGRQSTIVRHWRVQPNRWNRWLS